jgi:coenzyme F420-reducing hydrogenase delta subunit
LEGNFYARRRFAMMKELLDYVGVDPKRFHMSWVSASEGAKWKDVVSSIVEEAAEIGPFDQFQRNKINW